MLTWPVLSLPSDTHKWSTPRVSGTVPGARDGHSACVLGKTMYIFGGYEQLVGLGRKWRFRVGMRKRRATEGGGTGGFGLFCRFQGEAWRVRE